MSTPRERTILIVDDNEDDRLAIRRLLMKHRDGYTLREAKTGAAGLEACRFRRPDCLLLDFHLPDMDGIEFLNALQEEGVLGPSVPAVMLTGQENDAVASEALKRGAQDYLVKDGLTGPALVRAIENALEKFTILRELYRERAAVELRNQKLQVLRDELQDKVTELAQAQRAKDQFMAVMSHEMRTPLNAILGYADLLDLEIEGTLTSGQRTHIDRIRVGSRHLLDLINDVLDLARADVNKLDLDMRPVDVNALLEEVCGLLESQAEPKGVELAIEPCEAQLPHAHADLQRLRQVLTNLIGNAIKFTEQGAVTIRCAAAPGDGTVTISIRDTGIGIDPDLLPLIFTEFYQVEGTLTRTHGGSGLGLAIAQRLTRLMGGDIVVESTPGEGSTFSVILSAAEVGSQLRREDIDRHDVAMAAQAAAQRHQAPATAAVVAFGAREEALRRLEQQVHPGVRLVWTTDPAMVVELAKREAAALVVLDIGSTDGAGWRAAHALQDVPELPHTAVLLLPAMPVVRMEDTAEGLDLGQLSLVPKPFTPEQITDAVSAAAHKKESEEGDAGNGKMAASDVLVVDDDPDSRRVAAKFLMQAQLRVREAPDGESALAAMRNDAPDVVVLDLMMPVLDGFGVLAAMRADPLLADIPVVVLTAKTLTEAERQFLARTAVRVLQKGERRLADVAALVLRAAARVQQVTPQQDSS